MGWSWDVCTKITFSAPAPSHTWREKQCKLNSQTVIYILLYIYIYVCMFIYICLQWPKVTLQHVCISAQPSADSSNDVGHTSCLRWFWLIYFDNVDNSYVCHYAWNIIPGDDPWRIPPHPNTWIMSPCIKCNEWELCFQRCPKTKQNQHLALHHFSLSQPSHWLVNGKWPMMTKIEQVDPTL